MASAFSLGMSLKGMAPAMAGITFLQERYDGEARVIVGAGAEYAAYVEFGTSRMAAQPYLYPSARHVMRTKFAAVEAASRTQRDPLKFIVNTLGQLIEREAKKRVPVKTGNLQGSIKAVPASAVD